MNDVKKLLTRIGAARDAISRKEEQTGLDFMIDGVLMNCTVMLKEQEAVEPKVSSTENRCGNCNKVIEMDGWIACPWCGKPIAWNEWWNKNGGRR